MGNLSSGYMNETESAGLMTDLKGLKDLCDLIGIKLSGGNVLVRLGINAV